ncbi:hypothetical protein [Streptomyces buecherae]|uniref:hypothetical protein n=1 Tax=Streptomyces buecherae TaxID=2763006 RepID=UPI00367E0A75
MDRLPRQDRTPDALAPPRWAPLPDVAAQPRAVVAALPGAAVAELPRGAAE